MDPAFWRLTRTDGLPEYNYATAEIGPMGWKQGNID